MDEPTNHLDIKSKNVLKAALQKFEGTLLLVSHDRDFLQGMANTVYEFKDQKIKEYLGDINFYLEQRNMQNMREVEKGKEEKKQESKKEKKQTQVSYEDQKKNKALKNKLSKIESQIQDLEKAIKKDDSKLAADYEKLMQDSAFFAAYEKKKEDLEALMEEWEEVHEALENA